MESCGANFDQANRRIKLVKCDDRVQKQPLEHVWRGQQKFGQPRKGAATVSIAGARVATGL